MEFEPVECRVEMESRWSRDDGTKLCTSVSYQVARRQLGVSAYGGGPVRHDSADSGFASLGSRAGSFEGCFAGDGTSRLPVQRLVGQDRGRSNPYLPARELGVGAVVQPRENPLRGRNLLAGTGETRSDRPVSHAGVLAAESSSYTREESCSHGGDRPVARLAGGIEGGLARNLLWDERIVAGESPKGDDAVARGSPPVPLDLQLARNILGVASLCIPLPVPAAGPRTWGRSAPGQPAASPARPGVPGGSPPASAPLSRPVVRSAGPSAPWPDTRPPAQSAGLTLEMKEYVAAFDLMCAEARRAGLDIVGCTVQTGNFSAAKLDSRGGRLSVDALDVHLFVPPGAIGDKDPPQTVYIFVQASVSDSKGSLTPLVHCGPSSLRFHSDVILSFPHCARGEARPGLRCVKARSGGLARLVEEGQDGVLVVDGRSVLVTMDHFCVYSALGKPARKEMIACVFILEEDCQAWVKLRLFDNSKANVKAVKAQEQEYDFVSAAVTDSFLVVRSGEDVLVTLTPNADSWQLANPENGQLAIPHASIWRDEQPDIVPACPAKLFRAERRPTSSSAPAPFAATLRIHQAGRPQYDMQSFVKKPSRHSGNPAGSASRVEEVVSSMMDLVQQMLSQMEEIRARGRATGTDTAGVGWLGEGFVQRLCDTLDEQGMTDWHDLPEHLFPGEETENFGAAWVRSVGRRAGQQGRSGPTRLVLNIFAARCQDKGRDEAATLRALRRGLAGLRPARPDIQFAIDAVDAKLSKYGVPRERQPAPHRSVHPRPDSNNSGSKPSISRLHGYGYASTESVVPALVDPLKKQHHRGPTMSRQMANNHACARSLPSFLEASCAEFAPTDIYSDSLPFCD